jgi:hypothetical protein
MEGCNPSSRFVSVDAIALIFCELIHTGRSFPIQDVDERPSVLIELDLQLPLFVDRKLG